MKDLQEMLRDLIPVIALVTLYAVIVVCILLVTANRKKRKRRAIANARTSWNPLQFSKVLENELPMVMGQVIHKDFSELNAQTKKQKKSIASVES